MKRPVLVVSPIPSHPRDQGNSARIFRLGKMFQLAGHPVHFVYFGLEGLTDRQADMHRRCWDRFYFIQPRGPAPEPSLRDYFHVDDWFDDRITELAVELCRRWDYSLCLANYVWCSKHLEALPDRVLKVIDTHDVFGDRHLVARAAGMEPVWFYTSKVLEAMALERADLVVAIQDEEAAYFRSICSKPVVTVGYAVPDFILPKGRRSAGERLRVGYLGSGNPFNLNSILAFQEAVLRHQELLRTHEFHLAGTICRSMDKVSNKVFKLWGVVDDVADFYREMDLLVNPMVGGTGLKIKSVEVLAYGKPLFATRDAMVGIASEDQGVVLHSPEDIVLALLRNDVQVSSRLHEDYRKTVVDAFLSLARQCEGRPNLGERGRVVARGADGGTGHDRGY